MTPMQQIEVIEDGGEVVQATMGFDPERHRTRVLRIKENADDYRYFPDPDLIPLVVDEARIARARAALPELPEARRARFAAEYGLGEPDVATLTASRELADFFEGAAREHGDGAAVAKWLLRDVARVLRERGAEWGDPGLALSPGGLAKLVALVDAGQLTAAVARDLLPEVVDGADPAALAAERGLEALQETGVLEEAVAVVLAENADIVARIRAGEPKLLNALMGQVMKRTKGKADPGAVREILARKVAE